MKGRAILETFSNSFTVWLNPYSFPSKEIIPEEIKRLLEGDYEKFENHTMKPGSTYRLGTPAKYPTAMVETLKKYCETREEIKGAYLAFFQDMTIKELPHFLVGLEITENVSEVFGEVGVTIRNYLKEGEPLDMLNVSQSEGIAKDLKQNQFKIY